MEKRAGSVWGLGVVAGLSGRRCDGAVGTMTQTHGDSAASFNCN